jgi:hypothetical protein
MTEIFRRKNPLVYFFLFAIPIVVYIGKYVFFAIGNQGTMGIMALCLVPFILIPIGVVIAFEIFALIYAVVSKDIVPAICFVVLILLAIVLPLLPLPPSDTEKHFYDHKAQYQAIVDLAKQGKLPENAAFHAHLEKQNPLVILFNPFDDFYTYIAYAQKVEDLDKTDVCYYDGNIHSQIGDTWWMCFREWN